MAKRVDSPEAAQPTQAAVPPPLPPAQVAQAMPGVIKQGVPEAPISGPAPAHDAAVTRPEGRAEAGATSVPTPAPRPAAPQPKSRMEAIAAVSRAVDAGRAGPRASAPNSVSFAQPFGKAAEKQRATGVPSEDQIAAWIAKNGVTRLPAAAVEETSATIPEADRRAIAEHQAALDAAWREKNPQRNKKTTIAAAQAQSITMRRADR